MACDDPVLEAGFSRLSGEFGGNSGANSSELMGIRRTQTHGGLHWSRSWRRRKARRASEKKCAPGSSEAHSLESGILGPSRTRR